MANVTQMPPSELSETPDTPPPIESDSTPTTPEPAKKRKAGPGRGKKKDDADKPAKTADFFEQVRAIDENEWGQRAFLYVYIDEPVLQANTWGKYSYAKKLHKPILDLEPIKEWYGSCKGWISLNFRKSTKQGGDQVSTHEFEIFDIHTPSKIPRKSWANDQRNLKWEAISPEKQDQPAGGAGVLLEAMRTYREIREDMKEEMTPGEKPAAAAPADQTKTTLETMKLAKELFQPNGEGKTADSFATAIQIFNTLMQARAENPMVDMLREELKESRAELAKALEELRKNSQPAAQKGLLEQITEFAAIADKIEPLRKLFGGAAAGETVVRATKTTGLDIFREFLPQLLQSPIAAGLGQLFASMAAKNQAGSAPPPQIPPDGAPANTGETEAQKLMRIGRNISEPLIIEFFEPWVESRGQAQGNSGAAYAERINDLWPADFEYLQTLGADRIINLFMSHPLTAARLQPRAQLFRQFITEFLAFNPNAADEPAPTPAPHSTGVRDLEAEETIES